jgi:probable phosphoglycerate mutase
LTAAIAVFERPFYFLRHGETESNARAVIGGSTDVDLTPLGREQAAEAARALVGTRITHVYSSPLTRARDTATPIAAALRLTVTVVDELAERNWGVLEGQPRALRMRGDTPEGAETPQAFMERALRGLARVQGDAPLIVAHSGTFRVLCRTLEVFETEAPVANALPLRFTKLPQGWRIEPLGPAL